MPAPAHAEVRRQREEGRKEKKQFSLPVFGRA